MSEIQVISSTEEITAKETKTSVPKTVPTKTVTTKETQLNTISRPAPRPKKKKPVHAFKVPDFCKECREFCLNLKFHKKLVHGASCELCLSLFENQEKLDKHYKQWHKKWLIKQKIKKKEEEEKQEDLSKNDELKAPELTSSDKTLKNSTKVIPVENEEERNSGCLLNDVNQENKENLKGVASEGPVTPITMSPAMSPIMSPIKSPLMSPKIISQKFSQVSITGSDKNKSDVAKKEKKRQSSIKSFFDVVVID
jgi:hypothetical protein